MLFSPLKCWERKKVLDLKKSESAGGFSPWRWVSLGDAVTLWAPSRLGDICLWLGPGCTSFLSWEVHPLSWYQAPTWIRPHQLSFCSPSRLFPARVPHHHAPYPIALPLDILILEGRFVSTVGMEKCPSMLNVGWDGSSTRSHQSEQGVQVKWDPAWSLAWGLVYAEVAAGQSWGTGAGQL